MSHSSAQMETTANATPTVYPQRLVMMQIEGSCMFCEEPEGSCYTYYVCIYSKMGYITCEKCIDTCKATLADWHKNIAYGKANYLKDKLIKIKRSPVNGVRAIEDGWCLDNPITAHNNDGRETIHCYNVKSDMARWCLIDEILELNPLIVDAVEDSTAAEAVDAIEEEKN